jgi:hypothetical protein
MAGQIDIKDLQSINWDQLSKNILKLKVPNSYEVRISKAAAAAAKKGDWNLVAKLADTLGGAENLDIFRNLTDKTQLSKLSSALKSNLPRGKATPGSVKQLLSGLNAPKPPASIGDKIVSGAKAIGGPIVQGAISGFQGAKDAGWGTAAATGAGVAGAGGITPSGPVGIQAATGQSGPGGITQNGGPTNWQEFSDMMSQAGSGGNGPGGNPADIFRIQRFNEGQQAGMAQLLQQGLGDLNTQGSEDYARQQFNQRTIPSLAERFTHQGGQNRLQSSGFAQALTRGGSNLEGQLSGIRNQSAQFKTQQGLQQQFESLRGTPQQGFLDKVGPILQSLGQATPFLLKLFGSGGSV